MVGWGKALQVVKSSGIIIFPTETTLGVGCRISSLEAIQRLYQIKGRDKKKPTSILVDSVKKAKEYSNFTPQANKLTAKFWPGPLTLVLKTKNNLPDLILGPERTIGLRVPGQPRLLKFLSELGEPLLAPSANFQGQPPAFKPSEVDIRLKSLVDYVVDDESGGQEPSTVLDLTKKELTLLREGPISFEEIKATLGAQVDG